MDEAKKKQKHSQSHHEHPPRKRRILAWLIFLLVCAALLLPLLHHSRKGIPPGGPFGPAGTAVEVNTGVARKGGMDIFLDALGTVTPEHVVEVYSQVSGRVLAVRYREGEFVRQGQFLVEIDPRPMEAQLRQAEGSLARDKAALDQARGNLKRYQDALLKNAVAQQTVFDQEAAVRQDEGTVQNDEGTVDYYKVQLDYCRITAPISGRIGLRLIDPGNTVFAGASSTIAVITQVSPITVVFSVAEDSLSKVRQEMGKGPALKADLYDRAQLRKIATGTFLAFDNQVDTTTGTVKLRALFNNADGALFPNQFVNVRLRIDRLDNAVLIPTVAVQYNGQQAFVYKVKPDRTAVIQDISVVNSEQNESAVENLEVGESVVTSNFDRLFDGARVSLANERKPVGGPGGTGRGR